MNRQAKELAAALSDGSKAGETYLYQPTPWVRFVWWLFPQRYVEPREDLAPKEMSTEVRVHLDWRDRLRLLVSGKFVVRIMTATDVVVAIAHSRSEMSVLPPWVKM